MIKYLQSIFIIASLIITSAAKAQGVIVNSVVVTNPPATECTNTILTVSGTLGSISYIFNGTPFTVVGNTITISVNYTSPQIILPALTTFSHNVNVGNLAPGTYTVNTSGYLGGNLQSSHTTTFTVQACCPAQASFSISTPDTICLGDSVSTINTSIGATNYAWYQSGGFLSNDTNISTVFNLTGLQSLKLVVNDTSCSDSATHFITVVAPPVINLGNDTAICEDDFLFLNAGPGFTSYSWSDGDSTQTNTLDTVGTLSVTVTNFAGCVVSDTVSVVGLIPVAQVDLGNDTTICPGELITLNAGSGFDSYQWSNGGTTATIDVMAGTYTVTVQSAGTCAGMDTITVSNYILTPLSLSDSSACESVSFTAPSGYSSYDWSNGAMTQQIIVNNSGTYTLTVTDVNNCSQSDMTVIEVYPLPVVNIGSDTSICPGDEITIAPTVLLGNRLWSDGSTGSNYTVTGPGTYWLEVTDFNGCINSDTIVVSEAVCSGIKEFENIEPIVLFPNPTSGVVNILVPSGTYEVYQIHLTDLSGKVIRSQEIRRSETNTEINLSSLPKGFYLIHFTNQASTQVVKLQVF